jgi:uncharacterized membrane protein YtjA (UPF0391 family)
MLRWALGFLLVAILAAVCGFGGIAGAATDIARLIFFVFLVLFVFSAVGHMFGVSAPRTPPV